MDISVFISDLLFEHDCVIVPGFGGFICNYRPAEIHPVLHIINPPSKAVSFNVNISSNDGLLINYIAKTGGLTFGEAQELVTNWVGTSKGLLRRNETLVLKRIGRIFNDIEGNVQFSPDDSVNYLKSSFALKPITAQPILRGKEVDFTEKFAQETKKQGKPRRSVWKIAAMIILVAGIAALIQMMRMGVELRPLEFNEAGIFGFLTHFTGNHEDSMQPVTIGVEKPATTETPKTETPKVESSGSESTSATPVNIENAPVKRNVPAHVANTASVVTAAKTVAATHTFYIIIGAFSESKNADVASAELQKKYPNSSIISEKAGRLIRVGYSVGSDDKIAKQELSSAHVANPAYWLMTK